MKRIDLIQDVLPARDAVQVQAAGTIGIAEWIDKVKAGDPTAWQGTTPGVEAEALGGMLYSAFPLYGRAVA